MLTKPFHELSLCALIAVCLPLIGGCDVQQTSNQQPPVVTSNPATDEVPTTKDNGTTMPKTGDEQAKPEEPKTDEITLTSVDVKAYQAILKKHRGKAIVIDFWATWCVPCRKNFPHTVGWKKKYAEKGLVVISFCIEFEPKEDTAKALEFLQKNKATFPNLISSLDFDDAFEEFEIGEGGLPLYKVFNREGKLAAKFSNEDVDNPLKLEDVEAAIEKVLADG